MLLKSLALMLAISATAFCADITGKWKATLARPDGPMDVVYDFKVDGAKLTGTISSSRGEIPISEGKVEGDQISFVIATDQFRAESKGIITGDAIKLTIVTGDRTFEMTARRADAK